MLQCIYYNVIDSHARKVLTIVRSWLCGVYPTKGWQIPILSHERKNYVYVLIKTCTKFNVKKYHCTIKSLLDVLQAISMCCSDSTVLAPLKHLKNQNLDLLVFLLNGFRHK